MTLLNSLNALESAGLIRLAQLEPELAYLFRHALVQHAAYASLLREDRRRLHRAVGEAMESLYAGRLEGQAPLLAHHFHEAGDEDRARRYYALAGAVALKTYANQEAEANLRQAWRLGGTPTERAEILSGLGEALYRMSHFEEALAIWREGIDVYRELGDRAGMARLYARSGRAAWHGGDTPGSLALCQEGLAAVAGMEESADLARLIHEAGRACHFNGLPAEARESTERALAMARRLSVLDVEADALTTLGILSDQSMEASLDCLRRAAALAEPAGMLEITSRAFHNLGVIVSSLAADLATAESYYERAADTACRLGSARQELYSLVNRVSMLIPRADMDRARALMPRIETLAQRMADPDAVQLELAGMRVMLSWLAGDVDEALQLARAFLDEARARGDLQMVVGAAGGLGSMLLWLERAGEPVDLAEAAAVFQEAVDVVDRGIGHKASQRYDLAVVAARQGRLELARRHFAAAEARQEDAASPWERAEQLWASAELALAEARWNEALDAYEALADEWARLGLRWRWALALLDWALALLRRRRPADLRRAQALLREARAVAVTMGAGYFERQVEGALAEARSLLYDQAAAHEQVAAELAAAGRIQAGFLPERLPALPGWALTATLRPARATSGDFYDVVPLPGDRVAVLIADVADKGAAAAMFMAMCAGTIRTAIRANPDAPEVALREANERILAETHSDMFVTVFLGVLDPSTGLLVYCNAGHNPPLHAPDAGGAVALRRTGMALGIVGEGLWERQSHRLAPGDVLVLYTDGLTEAQNAAGELFGEARLREAVTGAGHGGAEAVQRALLDAVAAFVAGAPQFDDMTCIILQRLQAS